MSLNTSQENSTNIKIEVAYVGTSAQALISVCLPQAATIADAIEKSGILTRFPEIDWNKNKIGIFSKPALLSTRLEEGDRVEIYRPLIIDPKEARRLRVKKFNNRLRMK